MSYLSDLKLARLRRQTKSSDAGSIMKLAVNLAEGGTEEEREDFIKRIKKGYRKAGRLLIERALLEKEITKEDLESFAQKGFDASDIGVVLGALLNVIKKGEQAVIISMLDSTNYRHRRWIKERFNILVRTPEQALKMMERIGKGVKP